MASGARSIGLNVIHVLIPVTLSNSIHQGKTVQQKVELAIQRKMTDLPFGRLLICLITLVDDRFHGETQRVNQGCQRIIAAARDHDTDHPAILVRLGIEEEVTLVAVDGEEGPGSLVPAAAAFETGGSGLNFDFGFGVLHFPAERLELHSVDLLGTFLNSVHVFYLLHFVIEWIQRHSTQGESRFLDIRQASSQSDLPSSVPNRGVFIMKRKKRAEPLVAQLI